MAAGDIAARNSSTGIDELTKILQTIKGGPKTTTTSSEVVSNEKSMALLKQILEGTGGLASVSGAQKGAGLYNSSTNSLLTNDLLARSSANVAALSSQKTQSTQVGAQPGALGSAVSLGSSALLKPTITAGLKKLGVNTSTIKSPGDYLAEAIFGPSSTGNVGGAVSGFSSIGADVGISGFAAPITNTAALQDLSFLGNSGSSAISSTGGVLGSESLGGLFAVDAGSAGLSTGAASSLTDLGFLSGIGGGTAAGAGSSVAAGTLATDVGGSLSSLGFLDGLTSSGAAAGAGEAGLAAGASTIGTGALGAAGYYTSILGAMKAPGILGDALGIKELSSIQENLIDKPASFIADAVTDTVKAITPKWIICTELNKQGRLPNRWYYHGAKEFAKYDEKGKQGYYIWAVPSVKHLRKYPNSFYSKTLEYVFNARAEYLSAVAGCNSARKTMFGAITTHGLYAFCWILSRTIARKPVEFMHIVNTAITK